MSISVKVEYRPTVYKSLKQKVKKEVLQAEKSSPYIRKEISKVFQRANRRIQNIESKGLISPAVQALHKGDIKGFTKFSMKQDFDSLKVEYAKAVQFLRQPTSTAMGTRDYNKHLMQAYDLSEDEFNLMAKKLNDKLTSVSDNDFVERYLMRYKDFTGELEQSAKDIASQIETDAQSLAKAVDDTLEETANAVGDKVAKDVENLEDLFKNFKM
jgi:hypothetical protein